MKAFYTYYLKSAFTKRPIAFSARIQSLLQFFGIAIHNPYRDECCCDFECCKPNEDKNKNHCWLHIHQDKLPIRRKIWYEPTAPVGTPKRTFVKRSKLIIGHEC